MYKIGIVAQILFLAYVYHRYLNCWYVKKSQ